MSELIEIWMSCFDSEEISYSPMSYSFVIHKKIFLINWNVLGNELTFYFVSTDNAINEIEKTLDKNWIFHVWYDKALP
jgi:hypothetical protein